jgi:GT2 family glycosyltransferase
MNPNPSSHYFAAFVMTFERTHLINDTIDKLLVQSLPPEKILIIDNSITSKTQEFFSNYKNPKVEYFRVGKNLGPAGAAKIGLERLSQDGFKWIYWGDDDDPPFFKDNFEVLLNLADSIPDCGCVGAVGQYFNRKNGLIERVLDEELQKTGELKVDTIAGNMSKIIKADVVLKNKVLPDESLFFGMEELDYDLRMQKAGYNLYVDRSMYLRYRTQSNHLGKNVKRGLKKDSSRMQRDYYSTRNGLFIFKKNGLILALLINIFRIFYKMITSFKYGSNYGKRYSKYLWKALRHFLKGKKGRVVF